jgi:hypothetical protein
MPAEIKNVPARNRSKGAEAQNDEPTCLRATLRQANGNGIRISARRLEGSAFSLTTRDRRAYKSLLILRRTSTGFRIRSMFYCFNFYWRGMEADSQIDFVKGRVIRPMVKIKND